MSIDAKLQGLQRHLGMPERPPPVLRPADRSLHRLEDCLAGTVLETAAGPCFVADTVRAAGERHGPHPFGGLRAISGAGLAMIAKDPELSYAEPASAAFLDTETTGLGMGAGTYVFLVGAGYLDGDAFRVKQFFLSGPGHERAFLTALDDFLRNFSTVVSFNGKAFDWPLLENRFIRHRRRMSLSNPLHIDLLHPARRLWKRRLESCALSSLEAWILGLTRTQDDVPGWEIPGRYFQYQRTGDGRPLEGVFYHNLHDILSLAALTIHIDRVLSDPTCGLVSEAVDFLSLGKAYDKWGDAENATLCLEEALRRDLERADRAECLMRLAVIHKRERRWDAALTIWDSLLDEGGEEALYARVELAKFYEHVERDYLAALEQVQAALVLAELHDAPWPDANERDLNHRLSRLLNRAMSHRHRSRDRV